MNLFDMYGKETQTYEKTNAGEFFTGDNFDLFFCETGDFTAKKIADSVGEWFCLNEETVIYRDCLDDASFFFIIDKNGDCLRHGVITEDKHLLYVEGKYVMKEDARGNAYSIIECPRENCFTLADKGLIYIQREPCGETDLIYVNIYDYCGNYLEKETREKFIYSLLRDIQFSFYREEIRLKLLKDDFLAIRASYKALLEFFERCTDISLETIDKIVEFCTEFDLINSHSAYAYKRLKALFLSLGLTDHIEQPVVNVMSLNRCGEFCRGNTKFASVDFVKKLCALRKHIGDECFRDLLYDHEKLKYALRQEGDLYDS